MEAWHVAFLGFLKKIYNRDLTIYRSSFYQFCHNQNLNDCIQSFIGLVTLILLINFLKSGRMIQQKRVQSLLCSTRSTPSQSSLQQRLLYSSGLSNIVLNIGRCSPILNFHLSRHLIFSSLIYEKADFNTAKPYHYSLLTSS